jgi:hypothetical protein
MVADFEYTPSATACNLHLTCAVMPPGAHLTVIPSVRAAVELTRAQDDGIKKFSTSQCLPPKMRFDNLLISRVS